MRQQFELAQFLPADVRVELADDLVCYARSIVHVEWPALEAGTQEEVANPWTLTMFRVLKTTNPRTSSEQAAYDHWFDHTDDREQGRSDRIHGAVGIIPGPLWFVLLFIAVVIFAYALFFADSGERAKSQAMLMGSVVAVLTALLLLIQFLDDPYRGGFGGLQPVAMERTLGILEQERGLTGESGALSVRRRRRAAARVGRPVTKRAINKRADGNGGLYRPCVGTDTPAPGPTTTPGASPSERAAIGKAARGLQPPLRSGRLGTGERSPEPASTCWQDRTPPGSPSSSPCATGGCWSRLHLLSRRRRDHGGRPRRDGGFGAPGAGVRRRAPVELRRLRLTQPRPGRRRKRLRRDRSRSLGVGSKAPRGELRDRRPRPWLRRRRAPQGGPGRCPRLPRAHSALADLSNLEVWYRQVDVVADPRGVCPLGRQDAAKELRSDGGQGPRQGSPARLFEAHPPSRRRAADRQRPAGARTARGAVLGQAAKDGRGTYTRGDRRLSRDAFERAPPAL